MNPANKDYQLEVLELLTKSGGTLKAINMAKTFSDPDHRVALLCLIARELKKQKGHKKDISPILEMAHQEAELIANKYQRLVVLRDLAFEFYGNQNFQEKWDEVEQLARSFGCNEAQARLQYMANEEIG